MLDKVTYDLICSATTLLCKAGSYLIRCRATLWTSLMQPLCLASWLFRKTKPHFILFLKDLMALLTGELKVSKATPSGNSKRRDHCHHYLQELELSLTSDLCSTYQSAELHIAVVCLSGADLRWPEQYACGRLYQEWIIPDSCLIITYSFFSFFPLVFCGVFFLIPPLPASLSDYSPWQQTKKSNKKTHWLYWRLHYFPILYRPPFVSSFQRK